MDEQSKTNEANASETTNYTAESVQIEDLVQEGKLEAAMEKLAEFFNLVNKGRNELLQLQSRNARLFRAANIAGTLPYEQNTLATNQITEGFIQFIFDLKKEIPTFFKIADLPAVTHAIQDQKDILQIAIREILYDRYEVGPDSFLSSGDSGWFYRATIRRTKQDVVLKILKIMRIEDLQKEELARAIKLKHRNIIKIVDQNFERLPAYVMLEYINGTKLDEALKNFGGFPLDDALTMIHQLIDAFNYIRDRKILHANIRPSKIYLDDEGVPMISSLDIIKSDKDDLRSLSRYKEECRYLSPEALNETLDLIDLKAIERSDQFSLGLLLLEMISGKPLFRRKTTETTKGEPRERETTVAEIFDDRRDFFKNPTKRLTTALKQRKCSARLMRALNKMMAENPEKRFKDLSEVLKEMEKIKRQTLSDSPLLMSFYECRRHRLDLTEVFYQNLFESFRKNNLPDIKGDFKNLERQHMMLRFAVCVIFEIEEKEEYFLKILAHPSHSRYKDVTFFKIFLETLRDTVKDLLGDDWDEKTMPEAWNDKIEKTLAIVERHLQKSKT
jgi:serine/threonine protein kinase